MAMTLLIVDDHAGFRAFARELFDPDRLEIAGEAADGEEALEAVERLRPDVVLLDVQLPRLDGFEVARRLAREDRGPCVVLTSTREASDYGGRIAASPARGFIPKAELSGDALEAVVGGG